MSSKQISSHEEKREGKQRQVSLLEERLEKSIITMRLGENTLGLSCQAEASLNLVKAVVL